MTLEESMNELKQSLKERTDIVVGIEELFKDSFSKDEKIEMHDVDLRTRLRPREVSAMSVSNFLGSVKIEGLKKRVELLKKSTKIDFNMTHALSILMFSLKRHKLSEDGKSRGEITDILKGHVERMEEKRGFFKSIFNRGQPS